MRNARNTLGSNGNTPRNTSGNTDFFAGIDDRIIGCNTTRDPLASGAAASVGDIVGGLLGTAMRGRLTQNQRAAQAWYGCNGDVERKHCTGVFLKKPRSAGAAPVLGVYVDSHARLTDFGANKDIYLQRLANYGFQVSDIQFCLSREPRAAGPRPVPATSTPPAPLPELAPEESAHVQELTRDLPEALKTSVSRAISLSMRRNKSRNTCKK